MKFKAKQGTICLKGASGRIYCFDAAKPTEVVDGRDVKVFVASDDVVAMDSQLKVAKAQTEAEEKPKKKAAPKAKVTKAPKAEVKKVEPEKVEEAEPEEADVEVKEEEVVEVDETPEESEDPSDEEEEEDDPKPPTISTRRPRKRGRR